MCIASLSVSTISCQHRWYTLLSPCTPGYDLSNCPFRLQISGWEQKTDSCLWCSPVADDTCAADSASITEMGKYRLCGAERRHSATIPTLVAQSRSSSGSSGQSARRDYRTNSFGSSVPPSLGDRNKQQNVRMQNYLGYAADWISQNNRKVDDDEVEDGTPISRSTTGGSTGTTSGEETKNGGWKKVRKMSKGWFK